MLHLDHVQPVDDKDLLEGDLSGYASIMYDASTFPFEENIKMTSNFVDKMKGKILIEGACDEIYDAGGSTHNSITTPEDAKRFIDETGADLIVCNLGTEHRASGKDLKYYGDAARKIRDAIGEKIVLHGTSSVTADQIKTAFLRRNMQSKYLDGSRTRFLSCTAPLDGRKCCRLSAGPQQLMRS